MKLPEFDHKLPSSKEEAVDLLRTIGKDAAVSAGGTDLIPNMKNNNQMPETVISLNRIPAEKEQLTRDGTLRIDALSTLSEIAQSPLIKEKVPTLSQAAASVGGQQIRNRATLGGNLCQEIRCLYLNQTHDYQFVEPCYKRGGDCCYPFPDGGGICRAVYMSDTAPVLFSLDTRLVILGKDGQRRMNIVDFFTGNALKPIHLKPDELISFVEIPLENQKMHCRFVKASPRGGLEFAMVSIAMALTMDKSEKKITKALISVGAVNTQPMRAFEAEKELKGHLLSDDFEDLAARASQKAAREISPLPHHGYTKGYLKQLVDVHTRRSLMDIFNTLEDQSGSSS